MTKVYCKNCKWYKKKEIITEIIDESWIRKKLYSICLYDDPIGIIEGSNSFIDARKRNKNNDCPYYKRKWWKFGVK